MMLYVKLNLSDIWKRLGTHHVYQPAFEVSHDKIFQKQMCGNFINVLGQCSKTQIAWRVTMRSYFGGGPQLCENFA